MLPLQGRSAIMNNGGACFWCFCPYPNFCHINITNLAIYCLSLQSEHLGPPNCYAYKVTGECELNAWTIVGQETRQDSQTASLWVTALHRYLAIVLGL